MSCYWDGEAPNEGLKQGHRTGTSGECFQNLSNLFISHDKMSLTLSHLYVWRPPSKLNAVGYLVLRITTPTSPIPRKHLPRRLCPMPLSTELVFSSLWSTSPKRRSRLQLEGKYEYVLFLKGREEISIWLDDKKMPSQVELTVSVQCPSPLNVNTPRMWLTWCLFNLEVGKW